MQPLRLAIAVAAVAFFFTPLLLLAGGVRATEFENRKLASTPDPSDGWAAFDDATRYLVDHLPLRQHAVRFNTWKSLNIFGTTPKYGRAVNAMDENAALPFAGGTEAPEPAAAPPATASQVLRGRDGWLFLQGEVDRACSPFMPWRQAVARWERLARMVRESGRDVVVMIAPDKSAIYPDQLAPELPQQQCMEAGRDALWNALEASDEPALVPLRRGVLEAREEFEHPVYFRTDSHWNSAGATVAVREALDHVGSQPLGPDDIVDADERKLSGDLSHMLGAPDEETEHVVEVRVAAGVQPKPGRTVFVHDSYGNGPLGALQARFANFSTKLWASDPPPAIAQSIAQHDTVIIQTVEREVTFRAAELLTDEFFATLQRELAKRPR